MAVQLPSIQRAEPVAPTAGAGIIEAKVPDFASIAQSISSNTTALAGDAVQAYEKLYEKTQAQTADTKTTELDYEYHVWASQRENGYKDEAGNEVLGLRSYQGDPTEVYGKFDEEEEKKFNELLAVTNNLPEKYRATAQNRLRNSRIRVKERMLLNQSKQSESYAQRVSDARNEITKRAAVESMGLFSVEDPQGTLSPFEGYIQDIRTRRLSDGIRVGTVTTNDDGSIKDINPSVYAEIGKDVSDVSKSALKVLIDQKMFPEAKYLLGKFKSQKGYIDQAELGTLEKTLEESLLKSDAATIVEEIRFKSPQEQEDHIEKKIKDPLMRQKVRKLKAEQDRIKRDHQVRLSTEAYKSVAVALMEKQRSADPFSTTGQLEEWETFKYKKDHIKDPKHLKALYEMIEAPKGRSNTKTLININETLRNEGFQNMPFEEFLLLKQGLNDSDSKVMYREWLSANGYESASEQRSSLQGLTKMIYALGKTVKDDDNKAFFRKVRGKYTRRTEERIGRMQRLLLDNFADAPSDLRSGEGKRFIDDLFRRAIDDEKAEEAVNSGRNWFRGIGDMFSAITGIGSSSNEGVTLETSPGGATVPPTQQPVSPSGGGAAAYRNLPPDVRSQVMAEFKKLNPTAQPSMEALYNLYLEKFQQQ